jgi:hypothetical protein
MPARAEQLAGRTGPGRRHREREMVHVITRHGLHLLAGILSVEAHGAHSDAKPEHAAESAVPARELRRPLVQSALCQARTAHLHCPP